MTPSTPERRCNTCGESFPATTEHFPAASPSHRRKDGIQGWCRRCRNDYHRRWKRDRIRADPARWAAELAMRQARYRATAGREEKERSQRRAARDPLRARALKMRHTMHTHSRRLGVPYDRAALTPEHLAAWLSRTPACMSCGSVFVVAPRFDGTQDPRTPTVDRVDSRGGYEPGNIGLLCWRCNSLKSDATLEELEQLSAYVRRHVHR